MRRVTSRNFSNSKIQRSVDRPVEKPKPDPSARIDTDMPMMNQDAPYTARTDVEMALQPSSSQLHRAAIRNEMDQDDSSDTQQ